MIAAIPNWKGYAVTDCGRVISFWRRRGPLSIFGDDGEELRTFDRKDRKGRSTGYRSVCLSRDGLRRNFYVHELVLVAFVGPRPSPDHEVLHGNGVRDDNRLENLRWGTVQENADDRRRHGRVPSGDDWWRIRREAKARAAAELEELEAYGRDVVEPYAGVFDDLELGGVA